MIGLAGRREPVLAHQEASTAKRRMTSLAIPSSADVLFVLLAVLVPVGISRSLLNSDGDLARHIRVGSIILARHGLYYHDPLSYTMEGKPFVPYEWLTEVIFAAAHQIGGLAAVAIVSGLVIAAAYAITVRFLASHGVDPLLAFVGGILAAAAGSVHWLARPHLFTILGAILTITAIEATPKRRLWPFALLFAIWANLHGGFLYGLIVIALYAAGDLAEAVLSAEGERSSWIQRAIFDVKALGLSILACLINPSGPGLFPHVTSYLGDRYLVDWTQEYQSPSFHMLGTQTFLGVLALSTAALALSRKRPSLPRLCLILVNLVFALYSGRNIPLFAITALPIIILTFDGTWRELISVPNCLARFAKHLSGRFAQGEDQGRFGLLSSTAAVALLAVGLNHGMVAGFPVVDAKFDPTIFPVAAVNQARAEHLTGRIFNQFTWGGYILYAWPEQKVFIDGQTDFYGDDLSKTYNKIASLDPGWQDALDKWKVSLVIVPTNSNLAAEIEKDGGWTVWYQDKTAVILQRHR